MHRRNWGSWRGWGGAPPRLEVTAGTLALLECRMEPVSGSGPEYSTGTFSRRQWAPYGARPRDVKAVSPKAQENGPLLCNTWVGKVSATRRS